MTRAMNWKRVRAAKTPSTYGELINGAGGLDVLQGGLEISELRLDLGGSELGALKLISLFRSTKEYG